LVEKIKKEFEDGKDLILGVIAGCGQEKIIAFREASK